MKVLQARVKVTPLEAVYGLLVSVQAGFGAPELVAEASAVAVPAAVVAISVVTPVVMSTPKGLVVNDVVSMIVVSAMIVSGVVVSVRVVSEETMSDAPRSEVWEVPINSDWVMETPELYETCKVVASSMSEVTVGTVSLGVVVS
jgi:hypothetical protein